MVANPSLIHRGSNQVFVTFTALDTNHIEQQHYAPGGLVYYYPRTSAERRARHVSTGTNPSLPAPHIGPRQRRPHSIHIVSYPSGFVPHELRTKTTPENERQQRREEDRRKKREEEDKKKEGRQKRHQAQEEKRRRVRDQDRRKSFMTFSGDKRASILFSKLRSALQTKEAQRPAAPDYTSTPTRPPQTRTRIRPVSWLSVTSRLSRSEDPPSGNDSVSSSAEPLQTTTTPQAPLRRASTAPAPPPQESGIVSEESQEPVAPTTT